MPATTFSVRTRFRIAAKEKQRCWSLFRRARGEFWISAPAMDACWRWYGRHTPGTEAVATDFSPSMLEAARKRFAGDARVTIIEHNLDSSLQPGLGNIDAVISSFAIHHLEHERKRGLYEEIFGVLNSGGVFCNLEHVSSPSQRLHEEFLLRIGFTVETEDPSNKLLDFETQLRWLREIGFVDVDCQWKWRELALLVGMRALL